MRLTRDKGEEFMHLVNRCKGTLKISKFEELTKEQFDALIQLSALKSPSDEPLRARILQKFNQHGDQVRFDHIITDCVNFHTTKADSNFRQRNRPAERRTEATEGTSAAPQAPTISKAPATQAKAAE